MLPFLPLQDICYNYKITSAQVESIVAVMKPWFDLYGLARLPRLLTTFRFGNYFALAYGVHVGEKQLVNAIATMSNKNVVKMEHLVWIAILR
ncbi:hypothetical protein AeRB84_016313 [Aphanomyces euteiches]|nr:hypothetical protein AeRB84_016313 [Aphanomyces euteiches]